jgi:hypothetical protein
MMLRLVLVGMVAALGVTVPGGTNRGGWLISAGRWSNSLLVDWDTWRPDSRDSQARPVATARHQCEKCRLARAAIALRERGPVPSLVVNSTKSASVQTRIGTEKPTAESHHILPADLRGAPASAFESIDVGDDFYAGVAFELNRNNEGIDLVPFPSAPYATLAGSQPIALTEGVETDLPEMLCGGTDEDGNDLTPLPVASVPREANEPTASEILVSSATGDDIDPSETEAAPISLPAAPPVVTANAQAAAAIDHPELFEVFACQTGPVDEGDVMPCDEAPNLAIVAVASKSSTVTDSAVPLNHASRPVVAERTGQSEDRAARIPWPVFAPADAIVQLPNRVVQETTMPWPVFAPVDSTAGPTSAVESLSSMSAPRRDSTAVAGWGQAVDLTRQAMCAWVEVLVGSVRVDVTAR